MQIKKLGNGFFSEVEDINLTDVINQDEAYTFVRAAFEEHSVLLFRNQPMTNELQVAFSKRFGALIPATIGTLAEGSPFSILTNMDSKGGLLAPNDKETLRGLANRLWHTDASFKTTPALASVLSARTLPSSGGETEFASTRCGWENLPDKMRKRLKNAYAWHDFFYSRAKAATLFASNRAFALEKNTLQPNCWRMHWRNPFNGRSSLYIASHAYAIEGIPDKEAQALIEELIDFCTTPERTWAHSWRPGDVVMWDNRAVLHRARPWPTNEARHMVRTTIVASEADGLEHIRPETAGRKSNVSNQNPPK